MARNVRLFDVERCQAITQLLQAGRFSRCSVRVRTMVSQTPDKMCPSRHVHEKRPAHCPKCLSGRPTFFIVPRRECVRSAFYIFAHFHFPASGQAVVTGVVPSPPRLLPSIFIAHRVQQSHCSSIVHRVLLTHALALSASQSVHKKSPNDFIRVCTRRGSDSRN